MKNYSYSDLPVEDYKDYVEYRLRNVLEQKYPYMGCNTVEIKQLKPDTYQFNMRLNFNGAVFDIQGTISKYSGDISYSKDVTEIYIGFIQPSLHMKILLTLMYIAASTMCLLSFILSKEFIYIIFFCLFSLWTIFLPYIHARVVLKLLIETLESPVVAD